MTCKLCGGTGLMHVRYWAGAGDIACSCAAGRAIRHAHAAWYERQSAQSERKQKRERVGVGT